MIIVTDSQKLQYELGNVARLFFPAEEMQWYTTTQPLPEGEAVVSCCAQPQAEGGVEQWVTLALPQQPPRTSSRLLGSTHTGTAIELGKLLYHILAEYTGRQVAWGVLTGIRPVKLARGLRLAGKTAPQVEQYFTEKYLTTPQKAALCRVTDEVQRPVIEQALPHGYSLYISVPFCPSRCSYCSFVSHSTQKSLRMIPAYVDKLCEELEDTARIARAKGLVLQTVYMGGGTPTILTAGQLEQVLQTVRRCYSLSHCTELTVEAGRPDTITPQKLEVLRRYGVERISVNCQTLNDEILHSVGRQHTAQDFFDAFALVKSYGFGAVNVDLIAGLPEDTCASFMQSLEQVMQLNPQNITVHALTVKRAARLRGSRQTILGSGGEDTAVTQMVEHSQQQLAAAGYLPYYLYRQKGTVDSLENVGFTRASHACHYNIYIMDETHTILSVGGGGVTKLVMPGSTQENVRIERIFNYKYPYEYLQRFDIMMEKKQAILDYPL